ncbi:MAG: AAA family ATPase [Christensenellaceae bacterium]
MAAELSGTVANIIYKSADGYAVVEIEGDEPAVLTGNMPDIRVGECARFFGAFKNHPKYGTQFGVVSYESTLPKDLNDMALFLGGGFIKGLGEVLARRIVETFGEDTFSVIETEHRRLTEVKGVSKRLADSIHAAFITYSTQKYTYTELMGMGLTAKQAGECVTELGHDAAATIRENPYILAERIVGIDFLTADNIAKKLGIEDNSPFRIRQGILNVLKKTLAMGHMFVSRESLVPHAAKNLHVDEKEVEIILHRMAFEKEIVLKRYFPATTAVFLPSAYQAEYGCATKLFKMAATQTDTDELLVKRLLKKQEKALSLTEEQCEALALAAKSRVSIITGGPGTGKTTILKALLSIMGGMGRDVALCAPTGRAAKRMSEATGDDAYTIHRLLEYSYDEDAYQCYFMHNELNPLMVDVVVVDEVSMLDSFLFYKLLIALDSQTQLVLVGDRNQLPPVGPGNVMHEMIDSGVIPSTELTHKFRNAGGIADAAYSILQGELPEFGQDDSVVFVPCESQQQMKKLVTREYAKYVDTDEVQVVAPIKAGEGGTIIINEALREEVNPPDDKKTELLFGNKLFREGDRVMQIKNNYARTYKNYADFSEGEGVFNGETGKVRSIRGGRLNIEFEDGKLCEYELMDLAELEPAFCYTIHKSQGSEFDVIILPMLYGVTPFFTRNLLYTAVTRARHRVVIIGNEETLGYMVRNHKKSTRASILARELRRLMGTLGQAGGECDETV